MPDGRVPAAMIAQRVAKTINQLLPSEGRQAKIKATMGYGDRRLFACCMLYASALRGFRPRLRRVARRGEPATTLGARRAVDAVAIVRSSNGLIHVKAPRFEIR
jgi:hypothetical protein